MTICLQLDHVNYSYGAAKIRVLSDVNADFESGKMYAITGPSGAGKSTLLSLLAGLDAPSDGVVRFEGEDIATTGYSKHRREHVSLVFQDHNLIDYLTPEENLRLVNPKADMKILEDLGLSREESKRNIMHLSGGQRQRVAVGRALVAPGRAGRTRQRVRLPGPVRRQHRLQSRAALLRRLGHRPGAAGSQQAGKRPVPWCSGAGHHQHHRPHRHRSAVSPA